MLTIKKMCLGLATTTRTGVMQWFEMPVQELLEWWEDVNTLLAREKGS